MIKHQDGFTLTELLITMVLFVMTIAAATNIFVPLLGQFKQQSKIAETQIEGVAGLDLLRRDIEQAGFGLPWVIPEGVAYSEAASAPSNAYNETLTTDPPRAIISGDNVGINGSDYLVVKATSVAPNEAATKWAYVVEEAAGSTVKNWGKGTEDLNPTDRVIVLIPSRGTNNQRILVNNADEFSVQLQNVPNSAYSPSTQGDLYLIYGVDPDTDLWMPFNRAEYYVTRDGVKIPPRCAQNTGILVKSLINQGDGSRDAGIPLLDCVADMQVVYGIDNDEDGDFEIGAAGSTDMYTADISAFNASQVRQQVKEVRVYILAHEGQKDSTYDATSIYPSAIVQLPAAPDPGAGSGSTFDFTAAGITDWNNYRWKVYRIVVKPNNLRG